MSRPSSANHRSRGAEEGSAGGTWHSIHPVTATVSGSGVVAGVTSGRDTIRYIVSNTCGSDTATFPILIRSASLCDAGVKGVTNMSNPIMEIYPDPSQGIFTVYLSSNDDESAQIIVCNLAGQRIKDIAATTNKEITISLDVPPDVYFLILVTRQGRQCAKILVR